MQFTTNSLFLRVLVLCFATLSITLHAQETKRVAIYDLEKRGQNVYYLPSVSDYIVNYYVNDSRFTVIDKANSQIIQSELERQKGEEFMDGYIVEQGKQEGFDFMMRPYYDRKEKLLHLKVYDVEKGVVITDQTVPIKNSLLGIPKDLKSAVNTLIEKVNQKCFEIHYVVVRSIDKKGKEVLLAAGHNQKIRAKDVFQVYELVEEIVADVPIIRKVIIGHGKIQEVEDDNFSILKIIDAQQEIVNKLNSGAKLYASTKTDE